MRVLSVLLVLFATSAFAARDAALWARIINEMCPSAKPEIVREVSSRLTEFLPRYEINNDRRISHFLGQLAVESDHFKTTVEYASGSRYENRRDLGNRRRGDGRRFKGRGLIQLTGRANYRQYGRLFSQPFESRPQMVAEFPWALEVAGKYWVTRPCLRSTRGNLGSSCSLNKLADANSVLGVTRNVNGGRNHLDKRRRYTEIAYRVLQANPDDGSPATGGGAGYGARGSAGAGAGGAARGGRAPGWGVRRPQPRRNGFLSNYGARRNTGTFAAYGRPGSASRRRSTGRRSTGRRRGGRGTRRRSRSSR